MDSEVIVPEWMPQQWGHPNCFAFLWVDYESSTGSLGFSRDSRFIALPPEEQREIVSHWISLLFELEAYLDSKTRGEVQ